jgi:hypothetical protein
VIGPYIFCYLTNREVCSKYKIVTKC